MKKKYKVHKSHFSVFMYVYISLRSVFGSASTGHNRQVLVSFLPSFLDSVRPSPDASSQQYPAAFGPARGASKGDS